MIYSMLALLWAVLPLLVRSESSHIFQVSNDATSIVEFLHRQNTPAEHVVVGNIHLVHANIDTQQRKQLMSRFRESITRWEEGKVYDMAVEFPHSDLVSSKADNDEHQQWSDGRKSQIRFSRLAVQPSASWGLYRTATKHCKWTSQPKDYIYDGLATGGEVDVFVLGSGIDEYHHEFEGRAKLMSVYANTTAPRGDPWPYTTHIASIVGGKRYGVAKNVQLRVIRIMDDDQSARSINIYRAMEHLLNVHQSNRYTVMLFTMFGPYSEIMNEVFQQVTEAGVYSIAAAGGWGYEIKDTCKLSPTSSDSVLTVASSSGDNYVEYSNYGKCIDVFAPGDGVGMVPFYNETQGAGVWGSAQASAHAAGAVAILISKYVVAGLPVPGPSEMKALVLNTSTTGEMKFKGLQRRRYPDRMLYLDPSFLL
jgi:subtilisin family serine protease